MLLNEPNGLQKNMDKKKKKVVKNSFKTQILIVN